MLIWRRFNELNRRILKIHEIPLNRTFETFIVIKLIFILILKSNLSIYGCDCDINSLHRFQ